MIDPEIEAMSQKHIQACIQDAKDNQRIHRTMLVDVYANTPDRRYLGIWLVKAVWWSELYLQYCAVVHMASSGLELEVLSCNMEQTVYKKLRVV